MTPQRPAGSGGTPTPGYRPRTAADHLPRQGEQGRSVGKGLLALLGLLLLVVGVPALLVYLVGNPLPSTLPNSSWLRAQVTAEALIDIVAIVIWVVWAHFLVCLLAEATAARRGRLPGVVPGGGGTQLLARRLVAGVLLLAGSATMTGHGPGQAGAPVAAVVSTDTGAVLDGPMAAQVGDGPFAGLAGAVDTTGALAAGAAHAAASDRVEAPVTKFYEVKPPSGRHHDTLWDIADRTLGDPFRYKELYQLNKDRVQPDGRKLIDADLIQPGWQLVMPADATGPEITAVRTHAPLTSTPGERAHDAVRAAAGATGALAGHAAGATATGVASDAAAERDGALAGSADRGGAPGASAVDRASGHQASDEDGSGSVDLGDLVLGGGMVLAGLALAVSSRRGPYGDPGAEEQALRLAGNPARTDLLDRALRLLADGRAQQGLALPDATAVYVNDEQVIVHLAGAGDVAPPPAPWQPAEDGRVWVVRATDLQGLTPHGDAPWPALVSIALSHGFDLLVDLEYAPGLVSLGGAVDVAREVALSTIVDLVTHPWSDGVDVTMVGFAGDEQLAELAPGRVRHTVSIDDALTGAERAGAEHRRLLQELRVDGVLAGRLAGRGGELRPHVVVLSGNPTPEQAQRLAAVLGQGRSGLVVLCVGQSLAARWRFTVDSSGGIDLGILGLTGTARRIRHADLERVAGWVRTAATEAQEATTRAAALDAPAAVEALTTVPAVAAAAAPMPAVDEAAAHVGLLGPVVVQAPGAVNPAREALLTELVTLVALQPQGVHESVLRVSLWPRGVDDDVVEGTVAAATRWLGTDGDGQPLLDRDDQGRWRLSPQVHVDWHELALAAQRYHGDPAEVAALLQRARGEAFSETPAGRYTWLAFHRAARDARTVITAAARQAAADQAGQGDRSGAEGTLRSALTLVPRSQALWRDYLRLLGGSDPGSAAGVVAQMRTALAGDPFEAETQALVRHLVPDERDLG